MKKKVKKKKSKSIYQLKIEIEQLQSNLETSKNIASAQLGQIGILIRDNKKYKHEILMMQVEIQYLRSDRSTYLGK